jgi:hypothetical protein
MAKLDVFYLRPPITARIEAASGSEDLGSHGAQSGPESLGLACLASVDEMVEEVSILADEASGGRYGVIGPECRTKVRLLLEQFVD